MQSNAADSLTDHVTPYDRLAFTDVEAEQLLLSGGHQQELIAYFGAKEYEDLVRLARIAYRTPLRRDAPCVLIVPGIMGSQLGLRRRAPHPHDVIWLDPVDIEFGKLTALRLPAQSAGVAKSARRRTAASRSAVSLGAVLYTYLRLKLHLRAMGLAPQLHHYDWRLGVDTLASALAKRLRDEPARRLMIVAHSMGGLVSRAALALKGGERVERIVLLGTPNSGSYAPVQALRGTYAVVRKIARLDKHRSAEQLVDEVFGTFPSLYHMLPVPQDEGDPNLFDPAEWPRLGPRPQPGLLRSASKFVSSLPGADERFAVIVGVNQETVTSLKPRKDEFIYTITRGGDGTVSAARAMLAGARNYFAPIAHSELTRDPLIAVSIAELLRTGSTDRLTTKGPPKAVAEARIGDRALRRTHVGKVEWTHLEPEERRIFLQTLNEPPRLRLRVPRKSAKRASVGSRR